MKKQGIKVITGGFQFLFGQVETIIMYIYENLRLMAGYFHEFFI